MLILIPAGITTYVFTFGRARKLEIDEKGINFGRQYYGPFNKKGPFSIWKGIKRHKEELFIAWDEIDAVHIGEWSRWWLRYSSLVTLYMGDKRATTIDGALTELGIPVKRMNYYFLTIETKKGDYYSYDLQFNLMSDAKKAIIDMGRKEIINEESYNI
ncbi:hypothetical protein J4401_02415 [Candidatus Woesearchaeota archaeon]|nr:hypothetical protein [Candidatus Woesearchaeota archaeon]